MSRVAARAPTYFPKLDAQALRIHLIRETCRTYSAFYEFRVSDHARSHGIVVKIPYLASPGADSDGESIESQRPRLFGLVDPRQMAEFEFASLTAIQRHIERIGDPRLGAIRPLELLRNPNSVVMEQNSDAGFRLVHLAARRFAIRRIGIPFSPDEALGNAGRWLRAYHQLPPLPHTSDRMATRGEFIAAMAEQIGYLIDHGVNKAFLRSVRSETEKLALRALPDELDLATSHGDYAPRNLLVGRENQVTALDTLARWRAPRFEDVASFLVGLRAPGAQVVSAGLAYKRATLRRFESLFLKQYFAGGHVPLVAIRLFEGLLLLDRCSAFVHRAEAARGKRRLYATWRLATLRRFLFQYYRDLFRELEQPG